MNKPIEGIKKTIRNVFEVLCYNPNRCELKGSNSKRFLNSQDYDLYEIVKTSNNKNVTINAMVRGLKNVARSIKKHKYYWIEFKTQLSDGTKLRWSMKDVLAGQIEHNNTVISLSDALKDSDLNKLDIIAYVDGSFTEHSIIYQISRAKESEDDIMNGIMKEAKDLYKKGKYMKYIKRINLIEPNDNITDFVNSKIGMLDKNINQMKLCKTVLDINNSKTARIQSINTLEVVKSDLAKIDLVSSTSIKKLDKLSERSATKTIIKVIDNLVPKLTKIVNSESLKFIKKN